MIKSIYEHPKRKIDIIHALLQTIHGERIEEPLTILSFFFQLNKHRLVATIHKRMFKL
jgi:hypothetical protein